MSTSKKNPVTIILIIIVVMLALCLCCSVLFFVLGISDLLPDNVQDNFDDRTRQWSQDQNGTGNDITITPSALPTVPTNVSTETPTVEPTEDEECKYPSGKVADWWNEVSQDVKDCYIIENGFPEEMRAPAATNQAMQSAIEYTYSYVMDDMQKRWGDSFLASSPDYGVNDLEEETITVDVTIEGDKSTIVFVQKSITPQNAQIVVGPPNAGGVLYKLENTGSRWEVVEVLE